MTYKFICPKCKKKHEITMTISEYTPKGHKCDGCGTELERDVNDFCTASQRNVEGFFGVSKKT